MKNVIVSILSLLLIYTFLAWKVDTRCREVKGWKFYSLFPVPTCHIMDNIAPLDFLENMPPTHPPPIVKSKIL